ncbi:NYN domain-containing protein [Rhodococcus opacus]|uniref:NYN domain-containing protein n=1 Tax=Rhodococcus opacus (strain B4) TaxID=632772 RepID=C1B989_RHOOB|nr:NYN domain-containing protein [Rhodococcus opacus]BAH52242.1 hypothetical protein ROP_39950 [Rhodococcus opacus B4]
MLLSQRVAVVVDYQNMHLTARGKFTPEGTPTHESLLHPLLLAQQILKARANAKGADTPPADIAKVEVYRGLPSNEHDSTSYRRSQAQRAEWTRDSRVEVTYRPLRYRYVHNILTPQEKGVDVLVALNFVQAVVSGEYDVVILAAHDTDLEPALEMALDTPQAQARKVAIETAGWYQCKRLQARGRRRMWHTFLGVNHYEASRDTKDYT